MLKFAKPISAISYFYIIKVTMAYHVCRLNSQYRSTKSMYSQWPLFSDFLYDHDTEFDNLTFLTASLVLE